MTNNRNGRDSCHEQPKPENKLVELGKPREGKSKQFSPPFPKHIPPFDYRKRYAKPAVTPGFALSI
jgi:hypothetical protein